MESVSVARTNSDYFRYGVEHVLREFYTVFNKSVNQKLSHFGTHDIVTRILMKR